MPRFLASDRVQAAIAAIAERVKHGVITTAQLHTCGLTSTPLPLLPRQTTSHLSIPVTKPARALADLRRSGPQWEYRRALRQAEFRQLPSAIRHGGQVAFEEDHQRDIYLKARGYEVIAAA